MPDVELPRGRYLTCAYQADPEAGGQTRAMLLRNRVLAVDGGVPCEVLTLGAVADDRRREEALRAQGTLAPPVGLRNLYDHYREHGWGEEPPPGAEPLADLGRYRVDEQAREDGSPWRVVHHLPDRDRPVYDYLRADGTPFLRIQAHAFGHRRSWPRSIQRVAPDGRVGGEFGSLHAWHLRWLRDLTAGEERVFVFTDSRYVLPHLAPLRDRRMRLLYQMHNLHVQPPRRWDSPMHVAYRRVLRNAADVDAFVTLTERQRDDIAQRRGRTSNLHVVANPVAIPPVPDPVPARDPRRATVIARLSPQKRLTHAIAAWEQVATAVPGARLDVYGHGKEQKRLEAEIARRGLGDAIALRGFDPGARDALWRSSALLLTSVFEGFPLSTLEAMARGCPVVSYDIRYGPREQVTDGVDGYVVPEGDVAALAARVVELLRAPELVARMSTAARATAQRHDSAGFLARWAEVIAAADRDAPRRPRVRDVRLELAPVGLTGGPLSRVAARPRRVRLAGAVHVEQRKRRRRLRDARLELDWVAATGAVEERAIAVERGKDALRFSAEAELPSEAPATLRLRLVWRAFAWQRDVARVDADQRLTAAA